MSNNRSHRESRRRGFNDDASEESEPNYFQREAPRPPEAASSPAVDVEVLWFNVDKGFGFVKLAEGSNAFLHIRALEGAGLRTVSEGTRLSVRTGEGQKGPQVTEVLKLLGVDLTAPVTSSFRSTVPNAVPSPGEVPGTVKFFNSEKGFGFIALAGGSTDAFVHVTALKRCGMDLLEEGQPVLVEVKQGQKGMEVQSLRMP